MKRKRSERYAVVLVLLAVSLFSLTPAKADQIQTEVATVVFHLIGQATPMNATLGSLGPATLDLVGGGLGDGQGGLMLQNLTGTLEIGSANYSIFTGDGKSDSLGELMMLGESNFGELILHGKIQKNSTVTTEAPPSRLASLAYLALSGSMTLGGTASSPVMNVELSQNATSKLGNMTSAKSSVNSTSLTQSESSSTTFVPAPANQIQTQVGTVVFHLTGQATSMNATLGSLGSTTLDLTGGIHGDGKGGWVMGNLTGTLQIGPITYSISTGNGNSNRLGEFAIFGQSNSGELALHGTIQNNSTVTTIAPPSRLASLAYLALSGSMTLNNMASGSVVNVEPSQNITSTTEAKTSANSTVNSTSAQYTSIANFTSQTQVNIQNATLSVSNTTSLSQTASYALPRQNGTVTTTQIDNQTVTVYVSNTVANNTITQTTTTTVATTTITQFSSVTISNTTVIVTNSTTSGP